MTTTFTYPSAQVPLFPHIELGGPDDWEPVTAPGAVIAARAATGPERFAANIVVTVGRYLTGFDTDDAISLLKDGLREHPDAKIDEPFLASFGEDRYLLVNVVFDDAVAGTLLQVHAYHAFPIPDLPAHRDVVHVMGTCAATDTATDYPLLQQVMETVRVHPSTSTTAEPVELPVTTWA
jgi:hypothetical protein